MKIVFYCNTEKKALQVVEFYKQDIEILEELGYHVKIATKFRELDLSADLFFIWWWTFAFFPVIIAKIFRIKTIITGTFNYRCPEAKRDYFRRKWWQRVLIRFATKYTNANIFVSKKEFMELSNDWKYKNFYYSPHCIDSQKYQYSDQRENNLLLNICWTEKLNIQRKCLFELIDAIEIVQHKIKDFKLIIAGRKGDGFDDVCNYIKDKKLDENIDLIGEISEKDKLDYLQKCTLYLQPTRFEGFGLAIAEAMSCGATVITNNAGEVENVVGDAGILLNSCDAKEISDQIIYLLDNSEKIIHYGIIARQKIENDFPKSRRKKEINSIIERIIK